MDNRQLPLLCGDASHAPKSELEAQALTAFAGVADGEDWLTQPGTGMRVAETIQARHFTIACMSGQSGQPVAALPGDGLNDYE